MVTLTKEKLARVESKLSHIEEDLKTIRVVLNKAPNETFEAKIEITISGKKYVADEVDYTLETAIILATEEIERQLEKFRGIIEKNWEKQRELKRFPEKDI